MDTPRPMSLPRGYVFGTVISIFDPTRRCIVPHGCRIDYIVNVTADHVRGLGKRLLECGRQLEQRRRTTRKLSQAKLRGGIIPSERRSATHWHDAELLSDNILFLFANRLRVRPIIRKGSPWRTRSLSPDGWLYSFQRVRAWPPYPAKRWLPTAPRSGHTRNRATAAHPDRLTPIPAVFGSNGNSGN